MATTARTWTIWSANAAAAIYLLEFADAGTPSLAPGELATKYCDFGSNVATDDFSGRCLGHMERIPGMDGHCQQHDSETNFIRNPPKETG